MVVVGCGFRYQSESLAHLSIRSVAPWAYVTVEVHYTMKETFVSSFTHSLPNYHTQQSPNPCVSHRATNQ